MFLGYQANVQLASSFVVVFLKMLYTTVYLIATSAFVHVNV